jgi:Immunity protein 17
VIVGIIMIAAGAFSLAGVYLNWEWSMEAGKARFFTAIFGRIGARIFYAILGAFLVIGELLGALGGGGSQECVVEWHE